MSTDAYVHSIVQGVKGGPLLFVFHGTGGNEMQLLPLARNLLPGATVVAPRGDVSEMGAARFFRRLAEGRYDMVDLARATDKMKGFVQAHADARARTAGAGEIYGLGYSNGANILASVMLSAPKLFSRVVLMHPLIPFVPEPQAGLAGREVLIAAGRHDPICPPDLTLRLEAYFRSQGVATELEWHEGGHELRPSEAEAARRFLSAVPVTGASR